MVFILFLFSVLFAIVISKTNKRRYIFVLFILWMWILFCGRTDGADYGNYVLNFKYTKNFSFSGWEPLYQLSILLAKKIHLDFQGFVFVYSLIGLILICYSYCRLCDKNNMAVLLYIIYPFIIEAVQIRAFMSTAFVCFGFYYLIKDGWKNTIKYAACIFLAMGFHRISFVYFSFLLLKAVSRKRLQKLALLIVIASILVYSNLNRIIRLLPFIPPAKYHYFTDGTAARTKILVLLYLIITYVFVCYLDSKIQKKSTDKEIKIIFKYITGINMIAFMMYPLFIMSVNFLRIHRIIAMYNYFAFANYNVKRDRQLIYAAAFVYSVTSFIAFIGLYNWNTVVTPFFESNWIFDLIR